MTEQRYDHSDFSAQELGYDQEVLGRFAIVGGVFDQTGVVEHGADVQQVIVFEAVEGSPFKRMLQAFNDGHLCVEALQRMLQDIHDLEPTIFQTRYPEYGPYPSS